MRKTDEQLSPDMVVEIREIRRKGEADYGLNDDDDDGGGKDLWNGKGKF